MNPWITVGVLILTVLGTVQAVSLRESYPSKESVSALEKERVREGLKVIPITPYRIQPIYPTPYRIEGGTGRFFTKARLWRLRMQEWAAGFPYDLDESVAWVRANKISVTDPVSKKSLLVAIMSDDEIKAYLLQPWGRLLSGLDAAGLAPDRSFLTIIPEASGRWIYGLYPTKKTSWENPELRAQVSTQTQPSLYKTSPPQSKDFSQEIAWVKLNLKEIYNPLTKQRVDVKSTSVEQLAELLQLPVVRNTLGLPPLETK